jgi:hypothetical protein
MVPYVYVSSSNLPSGSSSSTYPHDCIPLYSSTYRGRCQHKRHHGILQLKLDSDSTVYGTMVRTLVPSGPYRYSRTAATLGWAWCGTARRSAAALHTDKFRGASCSSLSHLFRLPSAMHGTRVPWYWYHGTKWCTCTMVRTRISTLSIVPIGTFLEIMLRSFNTVQSASSQVPRYSSTIGWLVGTRIRTWVHVCVRTYYVHLYVQLASYCRTMVE